MVIVLVVSLNEKLELLGSGEDANLVETFLQVSVCDITSGINIEDSESIIEVEVVSLHKSYLRVFKFLLKRDLFSKGSNELILFLEPQERLLSYGRAGSKGGC